MTTKEKPRKVLYVRCDAAEHRQWSALACLRGVSTNQLICGLLRRERLCGLDVEEKAMLQKIVEAMEHRIDNSNGIEVSES